MLRQPKSSNSPCSDPQTGEVSGICGGGIDLTTGQPGKPLRGTTIVGIRVQSFSGDGIVFFNTTHTTVRRSAAVDLAVAEAAAGADEVEVVPGTVRGLAVHTAARIMSLAGADEVLVSGPPAGELVVTAGVQKMAPGLRVALPGASKVESKQTAR